MGPGAIPQVTFPVELKEVPVRLRLLRAHRARLESELASTQKLIEMLVDECPHKNASTWNTGDGDGSQGFRCLHCGTVGER